MRITNRVNQISYQIGKAASKYPLAKKLYHLLIANADDLVPHKNFTTLGPGALRRLFDWIPGIEIIVLGKPSPEIFEFALERAKQIRGREFEKKQIIIIGDMLDADILGAENFGADSLLVLSGLYQGERRKNLEIEMLEKNIFPTYVLPSIALT